MTAEDRVRACYRGRLLGVRSMAADRHAARALHPAAHRLAVADALELWRGLTGRGDAEGMAALAPVLRPECVTSVGTETGES